MSEKHTMSQPLVRQSQPQRTFSPDNFEVASPKLQSDIKLFRDDLESIKVAVRNFFSSDEETYTYFTTVCNTLKKNNDLLYLDRWSLLNAVLQCAQDGLVPDGREAAFIKYGNKIQYLPMIGGILKKVRESGELISINAHVVYERDEIEYWIDQDAEHILHKPALRPDRGSPVFTYAVAHVKGGGIYIEFIYEKEIQAVKGISKARNGPWDGPFADEMRKKTAIKRLAKRLPMSPSFAEALDRDNELYDLRKANLQPQMREPEKTIPAQLESIIVT